jgi:methylenetetrahydrofolate dehydrogenase (NADP+)/methenyltetrahydrofolate cyclohydrolase
MQNKIMLGKPVADAYRKIIKKKIAAAAEQGIKVKLAILTVGEDPASIIYRNSLAKTTESLGAEVVLENLPAEASEKEVLTVIKKLNRAQDITGILPMMPLPKQLNTDDICAALAKDKDVDCLQPDNCADLYLGTSKWGPCTPRACLAILDHYDVDVAGKHVVIIGRSNVVGKPVALLLLQRNATITICHSKTQNLASVLQSADIIVAAVGRANFVKADMVKKGAILVDVGINRDAQGKITGDIDPEAYTKAAAYTPVPGGVGTVCNLMVMETLTKKLPGEKGV